MVMSSVGIVYKWIKKENISIPYWKETFHPKCL